MFVAYRAPPEFGFKMKRREIITRSGMAVPPALLQKSAKPTNESSPTLQRWELAVSESEPAKRATEKSASLLNFQPSAARTMDPMSDIPSAKALGYYQSVRFADAANRLLQLERKKQEQS